ncbi:hypothetical protein BDV26DRAFT_254657 [Aspergillus bertholletiae]|uniref:Uncharacterized protein n=1 Tax=Aspergillus bertholletiae TaxID=1226010 RepID=A0A5N7BJM5_9EURO|nr:hypothetical protein BDV26DRAFT_254657 [Aspergillus bertholletiae]
MYFSTQPALLPCMQVPIPGPNREEISASASSIHGNDEKYVVPMLVSVAVFSL